MAKFIKDSYKGELCWKCSYCAKKYKNKGLAQQHERRIHNKGGR